MNSILKMLYTFLMFVSKVSQILILVLKQTKALSFLEKKKKKPQGFYNLSGLKSGHLCTLVTGVNVCHRVSTALRFIQ